MIEHFKKYISEKNLFHPANKVLLAVSGGVDSVTMCELFHLAKFRFAIAHCNFQLRGKESEEDEKFVKKTAIKYKVPFFSKKFNASGYAENKKISIQMAARELRYEWLEQTRKESHYAYIAVATQLNDEAETLLINLTRGTGISGLHGIRPKKDKIIRPLLFSTRNEILGFASEKNLLWREDSSNISDVYVRNKIRHAVIPILKEINPNLERTLSENTERIREAEEIFNQQVSEKQKEIFIPQADGILVPVEKLRKLSPLKTYLFEFLKPFGFNETVMKEIIPALHRQPGKKFFSSSHCIFKDRKFLIIKKIKTDGTGRGREPVVLIEKKTRSISRPVPVKFRIEEKKKIEITKDEKTACLDYHKLRFPLVLRPWKEGDSFVPFGMKGRKKISDFLTDKKIPFPDKEKIYVLVSFGKIIWVVGKRIDERFKVDKDTKKVFVSKLS